MNLKDAMTLVLITIGLSACAQETWVRPGASQADLRSDRFQCERDSRQTGYLGSGMLGEMNIGNFFDECMASRGWYRGTPQTDSAQSSAPVGNTVAIVGAPSSD